MPAQDFLIRSDFTDYYDHWFGGRATTKDIGRSAPIFHRMSRDEGMSRLMALRYMKNIGLETPRYVVPAGAGQLEDFIEEHGAAVLYHDIHAHAGEGKVLFRRGEAWPPPGWPERIPSPLLAVEYIINHTSTRPTSYRLLFIGNSTHALRYRGNDAWRSNCGSEIGIELTGHRFLRRPTEQRYPLMAIDYVPDDETGRMLAIDFNTAPGIKGTPIQEMIEARALANLIVGWIEGQKR